MPNTVEKITDPQGRPVIETMSDTEMLREILATMRAVADGLDAMGKHPMFRAMMPKINIPT